MSGSVRMECVASAERERPEAGRERRKEKKKRLKEITEETWKGGVGWRVGEEVGRRKSEGWMGADADDACF